LLLQALLKLNLEVEDVTPATAGLTLLNDLVSLSLPWLKSTPSEVCRSREASLYDLLAVAVYLNRVLVKGLLAVK
jgi:hypothetical protein